MSKRELKKVQRREKRQLRGNLIGLHAWFLGKGNPNGIGQKGKPLVFLLDTPPDEGSFVGEPIHGVATFKKLSPGSSIIRVRAEFESDAFVNNVFHFILWKTGLVQLSEGGHPLHRDYIFNNPIIMGVVYGYLATLEFEG